MWILFTILLILLLFNLVLFCMLPIQVMCDVLGLVRVRDLLDPYFVVVEVIEDTIQIQGLDKMM